MTRPLLLYVTDSESLGGCESYLLTLIEHADRDHFRVGLLIPDRPATQPLVDAARNAGVHVETLGHVHREGLNPRAVMDAATQFRRLRPAVVHFVLAEPRRCAEAIVGAAIARVPKRLVTFQLVAPPPRFGRLSAAVRMLSRKLQYDTLHSLIAVSSRNRQVLERQFGVPSRRLSLIPNGVDTTLFQPRPADAARRREWGVPVDAPLIGIAARLTDVKGQHVLLQAMPAVWREHPNTHVALAGEGPHEQELRRQASALPRADQVHFIGQQRDVRKFFSILDVFTLPSFAEGLPFAILEAMSMSLPVIASDIDGTADVIEHDRSGVLVPPGNAESLGQALVRLLDDRDLRRRFGAAARDRVNHMFNQRSMIRETQALYATS